MPEEANTVGLFVLKVVRSRRSDVEFRFAFQARPSSVAWRVG
jgi:hypothetical protein